jgi:pimeloyl-ACP methyl ester carboxylesterase
VTRGSDGVEIAYATHGAGAGEAPAVVLVHGWAGNRTYWDHRGLSMKSKVLLLLLVLLVAAVAAAGAGR